ILSAERKTVARVAHQLSLQRIVAVVAPAGLVVDFRVGVQNRVSALIDGELTYNDGIAVEGVVAHRDDSVGYVAQEQIAPLATDVGDGAHHFIAPLLFPGRGVLINALGNRERWIIG